MAITLRSSIFSQIGKPSQKEAFSLIIVSAVVIILLGVFVLRPAISSAIQQISNNKLKTELIKKQEAKLDTLEYLNEKIILYDREIQTLDESLSDDYVTEFFSINFYTEFKDQDGIALKSIQFEEGIFSTDILATNQIAGYSVVVGDIEFMSDYNGLVSMINYIESFPRILNIRKIELSPIISEFPLNVKIELEYLIQPE